MPCITDEFSMDRWNIAYKYYLYSSYSEWLLSSKNLYNVQ